MLEEKKLRAFAVGLCTLLGDSHRRPCGVDVIKPRVTRPRSLFKVTQSMSGRPRSQTQGSL